MNVDHLPGNLTVPSLGRLMACIKCGTVGADVRPGRRGPNDEPAEESRGQASLLAMYRLNGTPAKLLGNVEAPQSH